MFSKRFNLNSFQLFQADFLVRVRSDNVNMNKISN